MKKIISVILFLLFVFISTSALAAGSCTSTLVRKDGVRVATFKCTSDGSGNVSGSGSLVITGIVFAANFIPSATAQPTNLYDVTLQTSVGLDVLHGVGADLPNDDSDTGCFRTPLTTDGQLVGIYQKTLTPNASGVGASKVFTIELILNE